MFAAVRMVVPVPLWMRFSVPAPFEITPDMVFVFVEFTLNVPIAPPPLITLLASVLPAMFTSTIVPPLSASRAPVPTDPASVAVPIWSVPPANACDPKSAPVPV